MSELLKEPAFTEAIYVSYDISNVRKLNEETVRSKSERDKFLKRAVLDGKHAGGIKVLILRIDQSGHHEIHPEGFE